MWWRFEWVNEWWEKHSANIPWAYLDTCSLFEVISPPWDRRSHGLRVCVLSLWVLATCKLPFLGREGRVVHGHAHLCHIWADEGVTSTLGSGVPNPLGMGMSFVGPDFKACVEFSHSLWITFWSHNNWDWNLPTGLISSGNITNFKSSPTCFSLLWS